MSSLARLIGPAGHQITVTEPQVITESSAGAPSVTSGKTATGYDTFGDVAQTQDENGNITTSTYNGDGQQLTQTLPSYTPPGQSSPINGTSTTTYTPLGQVKTQTDPDNNQTTYAYDQLGDQTSIKDNTTGATTSDTYYADRNLATQTTPTGGQSTYTYDFLGRQVTSTQVERYLTPGSMAQSSPASYTTTTSYTPATGDLSGTWPSSVTTPAPDNVKTSYQYDAAGEKTQSTDGAGNITGYTYDALGRKVTTTNPDKTVDTVTYDPAGNVTAQASLGTDGKTVLAATSATYDGEGDKVSATDANGNATTFAYDQMGDRTAETQPVTSSAGIITSFGYDPAGDQTAYVDGNGNLWGTAYNSWNLPQNKVEPSTSAYSSTANTTTMIAYNGDQEQTAVTEPGGVTRTYTYDSLGNLKSESGSGAVATTATRTFTYDNSSNMLTAATSNTAGSGSNATSETFTYDDRGLVTGATGSAGTTNIGYNGDSQLQTVQDAAGTSTYTYDGNGRLGTMADPASGATLTYSYNPMSQLSKIAYGTSGDTQAYGYNGLHQLTSDTLANPSGTAIASIGYGDDLVGNLTSKTTTGLAGAASNTYVYDEASRLASWTSGTTTTAYGYDNNGNRTKAGTTTYTYDARDELTGDGTSLSASRSYGPWGAVTANSTSVLAGSSGLPVAVHQPRHRPDQHGRPLVQPRQRRLREQGHGQQQPGPQQRLRLALRLRRRQPTGQHRSDRPPDPGPGGAEGSTRGGPGAACPGVCIPAGAGILGAGAAPAPSAPASAPASPPSGLPPLALPLLGGTSAKVPSAPLCQPTILGGVQCPVTPPAPAPAPGTGGGGTINPFTNPLPAQPKAPAPQPTAQAPAGNLIMTAAGQAPQRAQQGQPAPSGAQTALPPALPNPGGGNPKGKGPLDNLEQHVIQQGAAAAATIVQAAITTIDPAVQACVDKPSLPNCLLAGLGLVAAIPSDGASALDDPALAEGLSADTGLTAGEADTGTAATAAGCLPTGFVPGGMSFTAATPVLLPDGKTAPIATLKPGDKVQATNTKTGKTSPETVAAVEVHHDTNLYNLNVKTPHGVQVIHTTANHLFWDPASRQWVQAAKLRKGEHLKTANGTTAVADGGATPARHDGWMWDLTVPGNNDHDFYVLPGQQGSQHNYHVEAGNTPVLVHNAGGCGPQDNLYKWPRNNGFEGPSVTVTLPTGYQFDRYGGIPATDTGRFASPAGTAFEMRSLPPSSLSRPFTTYEVVRPFDVQTGVVRPWGGQPGGGFQLNFSNSIADLLKRGFIKVVP